MGRERGARHRTAGGRAWPEARPRWVATPGLPLLLLLVGGPSGAEEPAGEARLGLAHERAIEPPGQGEARDRTRLFAEAALQIRPGLGAGLQVDGWRWDRVDTDRRDGPGDLQLHAWAPLWRGPLPARLAGWIKLPNADERLGLGTDQADLHLAGQIALRRVRAGCQVWAGLGSLGEPTRAGARWLVPEGEGEAWLDAGPLRLEGATGLRPLGTPARAAAVVRGSLSSSGRLRAGVDLELGLGAGGPRPGLRSWVGWASQGSKEGGRCCDGPLPAP